MASAFVTVLGAVPWDKVIEHAPRLVDNAGKLLSGLRKAQPKMPPPEAEISDIVRLGELLESQRREIDVLRADLTRSTEIVLELSAAQAATLARIKRLNQILNYTAALAIACLAGLAMVAIF